MDILRVPRNAQDAKTTERSSRGKRRKYKNDGTRQKESRAMVGKVAAATASSSRRIERFPREKEQANGRGVKWT